jgi:hypothetical protein
LVYSFLRGLPGQIGCDVGASPCFEATRFSPVLVGGINVEEIGIGFGERKGGEEPLQRNLMARTAVFVWP